MLKPLKIVIFSFGLFNAAFGALPAIAAPNEMLVEKDWGAYRYDDSAGRICFISSIPEESNGNYDPNNRGETRVFVSHGPDKTERNVAKILSLPHTTVKLNPTVAAYNVHLLPKLYDWAVNIGIQRYNFDSVYQPYVFAANNSEQWQKDIYKDFANNYNHPLGNDFDNEGPHKVINHVMKEGKGLKEAIDFLKILDYNRKTSYEVLGI